MQFVQRLVQSEDAGRYFLTPFLAELFIQIPENFFVVSSLQMVGSAQITIQLTIFLQGGITEIRNPIFFPERILPYNLFFSNRNDEPQIGFPLLNVFARQSRLENIKSLDPLL